LRDFGFGKGTSEDLVQVEVGDFLQRLQDDLKDMKTIEFKGQFHVSVMSSLWTIVNGEKLSVEDPKMIKVMKSMDQLFEEMGATIVQLAFFSKRLMKLVNFLGLADIYGFMDKLWKIMDPIIDEHKITKINGHPRHGYY
jgi:hypothetical protein